MATQPTTYYCGWVTCGKHFDTFAALPARCPSCGREAYWDTAPPTFEHQLTQADRDFLKSKHIASKDGHLGATEQT